MSEIGRVSQPGLSTAGGTKVSLVNSDEGPAIRFEANPASGSRLGLMAALVERMAPNAQLILPIARETGPDCGLVHHRIDQHGRLHTLQLALSFIDLPRIIDGQGSSHTVRHEITHVKLHADHYNGTPTPHFATIKTERLHEGVPHTHPEANHFVPKHYEVKNIYTRELYSSELAGWRRNLGSGLRAILETTGQDDGTYSIAANTLLHIAITHGSNAHWADYAASRAREALDSGRAEISRATHPLPGEYIVSFTDRGYRIAVRLGLNGEPTDGNVLRAKLGDAIDHLKALAGGVLETVHPLLELSLKGKPVGRVDPLDVYGLSLDRYADESDTLRGDRIKLFRERLNAAL